MHIHYICQPMQVHSYLKKNRQLNKHHLLCLRKNEKEESAKTWLTGMPSHILQCYYYYKSLEQKFIYIQIAHTHDTYIAHRHICDVTIYG